MRNICFYFQVHQPFRLRNYHFFDIGKGAGYFDEEANASILKKVATNCYFPANALLLQLIHQHGKDFKVSFSISGTALDQFEMYLPELIDSFRALADTGCVEFMAETYSHSLSVLKSREEFSRQVELHANRIEELFGQRPVMFRNTELIYADFIGEAVADLGFKGMLTEGADKVLGWRSPNYVYDSCRPELKLLLKNYRLSDDIAFRFSDKGWNQWPLTMDKYTQWLNDIPGEQQIVNLFMDYETFGEHQWSSTGIFDFLDAFPRYILSGSGYRFITPSEAIDKLAPAAALSVPSPISWADEERDLSAWLGNDLQDSAFDLLYGLEAKVKACNDAQLNKEWLYLQTSDHFYYMCTKFFADGDVHKYFNHYASPYEAFINYMNVLTDFGMKVDKTISEQQQVQWLAGIPEDRQVKRRSVLARRA